MFNGTSITLYCPSSNGTSGGTTSSSGFSNEVYAMIGLVITTFITSVVGLVVALCTKNKISKDTVEFKIGKVLRADGSELLDVSIIFTDNDEIKASTIKVNQSTEPHSNTDGSITRQASSAIVGEEGTHVAENGGRAAFKFLNDFCGNGNWRDHAVSSDGRPLPQVQIIGGDGHETAASDHAASS